VASSDKSAVPRGPIADGSGQQNFRKDDTMYDGVTNAICEVAWDMVFPAVRRAAEQGVVEACQGTVVVLDPTVPYAPTVATPILFEASIGAEVAMFGEFATAKAAVTWRTGLSSRQVQQSRPHLYLPGDVKWGGSVVRDDLIVAFSGVQAVLDEMIAGWMADALIGLCREAMTKPDGVMASDSSYLGRPRLSRDFE
jgi:hypothetical protein